MDKDTQDRLEYLEGRSIGLANAVMLALAIMPDDDKQRLRQAIAASAQAGSEAQDAEARRRGIQDVTEAVNAGTRLSARSPAAAMRASVARISARTPSSVEGSITDDAIIGRLQ